MDWYPLKFTAHIRTYAFGGRMIPDKLGKRGLPAGVVAETWEVSDYRDSETDASGVATNGPLAGRALRDLVTDYPEELVGEGFTGPHFPLLEKFIDATGSLPVHLHADDERAKSAYGAPNGKTEAWHIVWAAPGASILAGVELGHSREELKRAFKDESYDRVMRRYPISSGDTVYVPGGVLHAFGPNVLVFEVQQTSDLGQFVSPTGLYGDRIDEQTRESNIEAVLDELRTHYRPKPNPGLDLVRGNNRYTVCCAGPHFALERWRLEEPHAEPSHPERCLTLSNVGETIELQYSGGVETLSCGDSCILPSAIGEIKIASEGGGADLIACYVPDLRHDIVARLREAGYTPGEIEALGEVRAATEADPL